MRWPCEAIEPAAGRGVCAGMGSREAKLSVPDPVEFVQPVRIASRLGYQSLAHGWLWTSRSLDAPRKKQWRPQAQQHAHRPSAGRVSIIATCRSGELLPVLRIGGWNSRLPRRPGGGLSER